MNFFLLIDPTAFQSTVLAWIGVFTVLAGAISGLIALIITKINTLKSVAAAEAAKAQAEHTADKVVAVDARLDRQGVKMESLQQAVTQVALAAPATNGKSLPVEVINQDPIAVTEEPK